MDLGMLRPILQGSEEEEELAGNRQIFSRIHTDVSRNGAAWEFRCRLSRFAFHWGEGWPFQSHEVFRPMD